MHWFIWYKGIWRDVMFISLLENSLCTCVLNHCTQWLPGQVWDQNRFRPLTLKWPAVTEGMKKVLGYRLCAVEGICIQSEWFFSFLFFRPVSKSTHPLFLWLGAYPFSAYTERGTEDANFEEQCTFHEGYPLCSRQLTCLLLIERLK